MTKLAVALATVLLVCLPALARADTPPQDAVENIVMLKFNGKKVQDTAIVIQSEDGDVWLDRQLWLEFGLTLAADQTGLLSSKALGINPKFNQSEQSIDLLVPAELLPGQMLGRGFKAEEPTHRQPKGVMINYDLAASVRQDGTYGLSLGHEARMGLARGTLMSTGQLNFQDGKANYIRGLTTWNKDFIKPGVVVQVGDVFSPLSNLANPVNLGGVRVASDRALRQGEGFTPIPMLGGIAQDTTLAQLQVNGAPAGSHTIKPGPWQLGNYGTRNGSNELSLVITDSFGREQVITERFYVAPGNLPKGKTEFDVSVGAIRPDLTSDTYGELAASAKVEHGINDKWTMGATVQVTQDSHNLALSNRFILGNYGSLSVDLSKSSSPEGKGNAYGVAYDYQGDGWSVRASHSAYSTNHWMLSDATSAAFNGRDIASMSSLGFGLAPRGSNWNVGASYTAINFENGEKSSRFDAIARIRKGRDDFGFGVAYDPHTKDKQVYATWRHSFGPNLAVNSQVKAAPDITVGTAFSGRASIANKDVRWAAGATYRQDGGQTTAFGTASTHFDKGELNASVYYEQDNSRLDARWNGSMWIGEGGITTQRTTLGSFVLVEVPGQVGVPVSSGGGFESATNKRGYAMVPDVQPLAKQSIKVNTTDLPLEVGMETTEQPVVAPRLGGAKVVFPITTVQMREVSITYQGRAVEPPARLISASEDVAVGKGGVAVLQSPTKGEELTVRLTTTSSCKVKLPMDLGEFDQVIELQCKEDL